MRITIRGTEGGPTATYSEDPYPLWDGDEGMVSIGENHMARAVVGLDPPTSEELLDVLKQGFEAEGIEVVEFDKTPLQRPDVPEDEHPPAH